MKYLTIIALLFCTGCLTAADNELTSDEKEAGWKLLFDGKNFDQWKNFKKEGVSEKWGIKDGAMVMSKGGGDIMTKKSYKNFELKLDWKISKNGNSGIFILADEKGPRIYSHAPEIQIIDANEKTRPVHTSGSLYDMIAAPKESQKPAEEWNKVRIKLNEKHLQVWQNDIKTVDVVIDSDKWKELVGKSKFKKWKGFAANSDVGGALGLQDHGNVVSFKNLKIKEL